MNDRDTLAGRDPVNATRRDDVLLRLARVFDALNPDEEKEQAHPYWHLYQRISAEMCAKANARLGTS